MQEKATPVYDIRELKHARMVSGSELFPYNSSSHNHIYIAK